VVGVHHRAPATNRGLFVGAHMNETMQEV